MSYRIITNQNRNDHSTINNNIRFTNPKCVPLEILPILIILGEIVLLPRIQGQSKKEESWQNLLVSTLLLGTHFLIERNLIWSFHMLHMS